MSCYTHSKRLILLLGVLGIGLSSASSKGAPGAVWWALVAAHRSLVDGVPLFYVDEALNWTAIRCDGKPLSAIVDSTYTKHSDDYWFYRHALAHPKRTDDPAEAKLFVVGVLNNLIAEVLGYSGWRCCDGERCGEALLDEAERHLASSPWFARHGGTDHVVVASHWNADAVLRPSMRACNLVSFETNRAERDRLVLAKTHVGHKCAPWPNRTHDLAFIGHLHPERESFAARRRVCELLAASPYRVAACGEGPQCPVLASARLGFHVRGDTYGSNRLIDTLISDVVPIFTAPEQYAILPPFLPWRQIGPLVDVDAPDRDFWAALDHANRTAPRFAAHNRRLGLETRLEWRRSPFLFERYMTCFHAWHCARSEDGLLSATSSLRCAAEARRCNLDALPIAPHDAP